MKVIKKYPGGPPVGTLVEKNFDGVWRYPSGHGMIILGCNPEGYPEFFDIPTDEEKSKKNTLIKLLERLNPGYYYCEREVERLTLNSPKTNKKEIFVFKKESFIDDGFLVIGEIKALEAEELCTNSFGEFTLLYNINEIK